jgi:hypothetical protein
MLNLASLRGNETKPSVNGICLSRRRGRRPIGIAKLYIFWEARLISQFLVQKFELFGVSFQNCMIIAAITIAVAVYVGIR